VLRKNSPRHLVAVYDLVQEKDDSLCASSREVAVVIEPIPYRLSDLGVLSFSEGMYVLKCVLEGYRVLAAHSVDFYLLDETAICFNRQGVCKFWLNENLHLSRPHPNRIISETAFLASLLEIVELRLSHQPPEYSSQKQAFEPLTLQGLLSIVDRFRDANVRCMASLSTMGQFSSPHSTKYPHSTSKLTPPTADHKVSISKFRRTNRRRL
jgi:hypothetical protein